MVHPSSIYRGVSQVLYKVAVCPSPDSCSQILSPWLGDIVDCDIGLSPGYTGWRGGLVRQLYARVDYIPPSQRLRIWLLAIYGIFSCSIHVATGHEGTKAVWEQCLRSSTNYVKRSGNMEGEIFLFSIRWRPVAMASWPAFLHAVGGIPPFQSHW